MSSVKEAREIAQWLKPKGDRPPAVPVVGK